MASKTPGKKFSGRQKNGKFISVKEQKRRNSAFLLCKRFCMNPEGEREDLETAAEASSAVISWDEGRRVLELGFLAEGLRACKDCSNPLELANTLSEKRYGLGSVLHISCSCGQLNTISTGKSHRSASARRGLPIYDVNTKLATGKKCFIFISVQTVPQKSFSFFFSFSESSKIGGVILTWSKLPTCNTICSPPVRIILQHCILLALHL